MFNQKKRNKATFATKIKELFGKKSFSEEFFESLEDLLIESDVGTITTMEMVEELRLLISNEAIKTEEEVIESLKKILIQAIQPLHLEASPKELSLYLVLGVNGVGKTTSIAKMARYYQIHHSSIDMVLAAADTFRAAAIDQLKYHAAQLKLPIIAHQDGSDPASVVYDAIEHAIAKNKNLVIADTAGRMHNKSNLINELQKVARVTEKFNKPVTIKKILVLDVTTGQNAVNQTEIFHEAVGLDAIILSKYDSLSKGGIAITIGKKFKIPIAFVGTGEKMEDLTPFDPKEFVDRIMNNPIE